MQHGLGRPQSSITEKDLDTYDEVRKTLKSDITGLSQFALDDIHNPTTLHHGPLSFENVIGSVHKVLCCCSMGSHLVLGLAVFYSGLGCFDNISLSSSVQITDSLESRPRNLYRHSEYYESKECDQNKLIENRWP